MAKTIMITGATDGIGLETAKLLAQQGHRLIVHGRSIEKLDSLTAELKELTSPGDITALKADLSDLDQVKTLAEQVKSLYSELDVLINNAGVFKTSQPRMDNGQDIRFVVNTLAPVLLIQLLLPLMSSTSRVVNLSSAAQAPVNLDALRGEQSLSDNEAYAQSKLALTMWSRYAAQELGSSPPVIVAVNPASFLGSKMVKEAYGVSGGDLSVGADILVRAALSEEFATASGAYYDNDNQRFANPHADALSVEKSAAVIAVIESMISN